MEGPSKAEIAFEDRKDGSCGVSYVVQEPGGHLARPARLSRPGFCLPQQEMGLPNQPLTWATAVSLPHFPPPYTPRNTLSPELSLTSELILG